mmetsp:Transcript_57896/g.137789  ORF Transcript_57896/g.137789 Transcript_57896/m.137789 type:complete len:424 (-) Transcript_57896:70-1341(-)
MAHHELDVILGVLHDRREVSERHLRLDHPELCEVAGRLGVLRAEGGPERVDVSQRARVCLPRELARDSEVRRLSEEVLGVVDLAGLGLRQLAHRGREGGHAEHLAGALAVTRRDQRGLEVEEPHALEVVVRRLGESGADARHGRDGVCPRPQVRDSAEEFEGVALLLERVLRPRAVSHQLHLNRLDVVLLALALALDERAADRDGGARADLVHLAVCCDVRGGYHLDALRARAVVDFDEGELLLAPLRSHPPLHHHLLPHKRRVRFHERLDLVAPRSERERRRERVRHCEPRHGRRGNGLLGLLLGRGGLELGLKRQKGADSRGDLLLGVRARSGLVRLLHGAHEFALRLDLRLDGVHRRRRAHPQATHRPRAQDARRQRRGRGGEAERRGRRSAEGGECPAHRGRGERGGREGGGRPGKNCQ